MQLRRGKNPPPTTMIFLRGALEDASISFNQAGELVKQATFTRRYGKDRERFIVASREGSAMFFIFRWDKTLRDDTGDWIATQALAGAGLDDLYEIANEEQRSVLDDTRWDPI